MSRTVTNAGFFKHAAVSKSAVSKRATLSLLAGLCLMVVPTTARAACGIYAKPGFHGAGRLPSLASAGINLPALAQGDPDSDRGPDKSIVGLWHVLYTTSGNEPFNNTFDMWHSDGTEFESAFLAPADGDVCVGVWKELGSGWVRLHHVGWLFNPDTPKATATNYFTLDEENRVSANGKTYTGTFTFKVWNLDGSPTPQVVTGTIEATRITVN